MKAPSSLTHFLIDDDVVLALTGEFDLSWAQALNDELVDISRRWPDRMLLVDMTGTTFLDSTALGAIVGAYQRSVSNGGALRIVSPQPMVRRLLGMTHIDQLVPVVDSIDAGRAYADPLASQN